MDQHQVEAPEIQESAKTKKRRRRKPRIIIAVITAAGAIIAALVTGVFAVRVAQLGNLPASQTSGSVGQPNGGTTPLPTTATQPSRNNSTPTDSTRVSLASPVGDEVVLNVAVLRPSPSGQTYWLMVQFQGGANTVYKALAKVSGSQSIHHSIANSPSGSIRTYYVVAADPATARQLQENLDHPDPGWDGNRTVKPAAGVVSNRLEVPKP